MIQNKKIIDRLKKLSVYEDCFKNHNLELYSYSDAYNFFDYSWKIYEKFKRTYKLKHGKEINNGINGQAFEFIFGLILDHENIVIDSYDEEIPNIPLVKPDFVVKKNSNNFFISLKVSIRERWKQAEWESLKYKKYYTNAISYLLINHERECLSLKKKLPLLDIDNIYYASSKDINDLVSNLK